VLAVVIKPGPEGAKKKEIVAENTWNYLKSELFILIKKTRTQPFIGFYRNQCSERRSHKPGTNYRLPEFIGFA
jgi:hypothetical protein